MEKVLEAFDRITDMISEYEDFMVEMPFCPEFETDFSWDDVKTVRQALEQITSLKEENKELNEQLDYERLMRKENE